VDPAKITKVANLIENNAAVQSKYEDNFLIAYEIAQKNPAGFYATINDPQNLWGKDADNKQNIFQYKSIASGAPITFVNMGTSAYSTAMTIQMKSSAVKSVQVLGQNGQVLANFSLTADWQTFNAQIPLPPGNSQITFKLLDGDGKEMSIAPNNLDTQGAQIKSISFSE